METVLKIDPEFQNKIPPLTEAEFKQLEENILEAGQIYEPIAVWNGVIVDGHNRYKICKAHPEIELRVREMDFTDKWAAFDWMYKNQLGRRNLTKEQREFLIGKQYEARKKIHGGDRKSKEFSSDQSGHLIHGRIKEQIAKEQGVGQGTVQRAEEFAKGIDAIREAEPSLAESILQSHTKVRHLDVRAVGKADPEKRKSMIKDIKAGKQIATWKEIDGNRQDKESALQDKNRMQEIEKVATRMITDNRNTHEYTIDDFLRSFEINVAPFINLIRRTISGNAELCKANKQTVIQSIRENIINKIEEIEREIMDYE